MVKKVRYFYISLIALLLTCLAFDILSPSKKISFLGCAYFIIFISIALFLILRGFYYKIDTNIYFGILLFISPVCQLLINFELTRYFYFCITVFLFLTLASLVVWKYFKDKTHKLFFFVFLVELFIFFIPFCLTNFQFWYLILLAIIWAIAVIAFGYFKFKKR